MAKKNSTAVEDKPDLVAPVFCKLEEDTDKALQKFMSREEERNRGTAVRKLVKRALKAEGLL